MSLKQLLLTLATICCCGTIFYACKYSQAQPVLNATAIKEPAGTPRVLVFMKTKGFYHESIPAGAAAIMKLGSENNLAVDTTRNSEYFVEDSLKMEK